MCAVCGVRSVVVTVMHTNQTCPQRWLLVVGARSDRGQSPNRISIQNRKGATAFHKEDSFTAAGRLMMRLVSESRPAATAV
jgi:hypothetical protein